MDNWEKNRRWDYECSLDGKTLYTWKKGKRREHSKLNTKKFKSKGMICDEKVIATPVSAIWSSIGIVVPNLSVTENIQEVKSFNSILQKAPHYIRDTIGWVTFDEDLKQRLKETWNSGVYLTSATDGGYGDEIGSWGYLLFFDNEEKPILQGYSAEMSEFDTI